MQPGGPSKFVWVRLGNCTTDAIAQLLRRHHDDIIHELDETRQHYVAAHGAVRIVDGSVQPALPFMFSRLASA